MRPRTFGAALSMAVIALAPALSPAETLATDVAGVPKENVGVNGPKTHHLEGLELVGHAPMPVTVERYDEDGQPYDVTLPIGNNGAPALLDDCAYIGRWHDYTGAWGISIVDVSDPSAPARVGSITEGLPAGAVAREIRIVDAGSMRMLVVLLFSRYLDSGLVEPGLNAIAFYDIGEDCTSVTHRTTYDTRPFRGHEFALWLDPDPAHDVDGHPRVILYLTAPIGPGSLVALDASRPEETRVLGVYDSGQPVISPREDAGDGLGTYAHSVSVSPDGRRAYVSYWDGGFLVIDTSEVADALPAAALRPAPGAQGVPFVPPIDEYANVHSAVVAPGTTTAVVGSEIYLATDGCPFGWMKTIDIGSATSPPGLLGEYRLKENEPATCEPSLLPTGTPRAQVRNENGALIDGTFSMHNQTVTQHFAFATWYGGGLRVVDITDPATPSEAGAFVPAPVPDIATSPATSAPTYGTYTPLDPSDDWWVAAWSYPIIRDGLIYFTDVRNGLYILRPSADASFAAEVASIDYLDGNSNRGDL